MIKKILYLTILLAFTTVCVQAQDLMVTPSDTLALDTTTSCQAESIMTIALRNNTNAPLQMNWRLVYNTSPHGWTIDYCDPLQCLSGLNQIGAGVRQFTLDTGVNGLMQFEPTPTTGTGLGYFQVFTWATNDSANTATYLNYRANITAVCANGITEPTVTQISLYPNPVRSEMKVTLPQNLANGKIDIYDLIGSKVYSQSISTTEDIDLSALETGIYMVRISDSGKIIATRKFTKQN